MEFSKKGLRRISVLIALGSAAIAVVLFSMIDTTKPGSDEILREQMGALGGVLMSLLVASRIKDPALTFVLAACGLLLGTSVPWLAQILQYGGFSQRLAASAEVGCGAAFGFGISMLSRSAMATAKERREDEGRGAKRVA